MDDANTTTCSTCGALVGDPEQHSAWHARFADDVDARIAAALEQIVQRGQYNG
jgi:hypothetical protein